MADIKDTINVNVQGALLGVQEGGFSFVTQFRNLPRWKRALILTLAIAIVPVYLVARFGTEQYLAQQYGRQALSAHSAFNTAQDPIIGKTTVIRNPNNTYSAIVQITNPNIDLSANNINYTATFQDSSKKTVYTTSGTTYLLPNEKKFIAFPRIESGAESVSSGTLTLRDVNWQKRLDVPEVELRASEPILYDEANPLNFIAEGSIINDSPYRIGTARITFILYNSANEIIGVSQRDESRLLPFGRRAYKQLWPGLYRSQVSRVQVITTTNTLDQQNLSVETVPTTNSNTNSDPFSDPF